MRLFLDTSVLLAASGSTRGAAHFLVTQSEAQGWKLISSDYCREEVLRNLKKFDPAAHSIWQRKVAVTVSFSKVRLALDRVLIFPKAKDRPVVITALSCDCEWLLTLDERDFHGNLGNEIYGMRIGTPGKFLVTQREAGHI